MEYILGIDSGATGSEALITDWEGNVSLNEMYMPVNCNILGLDKTSQRLAQIIKRSLQKFKNNVSCIVIGISGAREENQRNIISKFLKEKTGLKNIYVYPDTAIAFYSVFKHGEINCGILIAGTGSILYYMDSAGQFKQAGGWGRIIGDEGSGYWIGREALKQATLYYDGIGSSSFLVDTLKKNYGLGKSSVINKIYNEKFEIQRLAETVFNCAEKGDKVSNDIIRNAAGKLAEHFKVLKKKKYTIALCGSLFSKQPLMEKYLKQFTRTLYPNIKIIEAERSPVFGAIRLGKLTLVF